MQQLTIHLASEADGAVVATGGPNGATWTHTATAVQVAAARSAVDRLFDGFESGHRPLADPVALAQLGLLLRDTYLAPLNDDPARPLEHAEGRLSLVSSASACLNLPWELLPGRDGRFLVADGRWAIRRAVRADLPAAGLPLVPRPLRILFTACAPQHAELPALDYEREEEAILRIADRLDGQVFLDIAEAGTFDELQDLISELRPPSSIYPATACCTTAWAGSASRTNGAGWTFATGPRWPNACLPAAACGWCLSAAASRRKQAWRACARA